ncbi:hypothetical protein DPMN_066089 [Dreissena polymorpha]|uniref:Uncharacterized protein n=1 Tax=Dreissena polymorpha TaxID=45954 RepID=A0A9D3YX42_DREPO|nr:hypothetical protein DPMN_066089 [Dreissena polymorpha]
MNTPPSGSPSTKHQHPLSSLVEEFEIDNTRLVLTLKDFQNEHIREAGIYNRTSRIRSATETVSQAVNSPTLRDIVGLNRQKSFVEQERDALNDPGKSQEGRRKIKKT